MADPGKYVLFSVSPDGERIPVNVMEPQIPPSNHTDELWEISRRIEEISDEIETEGALVKDLRNCSWLLRATVLGKLT